MGYLSLFDAMARDFSPYVESVPVRGLPGVDVCETADSYVLEMDLPGRNEKDVSVELKDSVLSISVGSAIGAAEPAAVTKTENNENAANEGAAIEEEAEKNQFAGRYLIRERSHVDFTRNFTLPRDIDRNNVSAVFKNGVLTVTVMRKEEAKAAKIAISAA